MADLTRPYGRKRKDGSNLVDLLSTGTDTGLVIASDGSGSVIWQAGSGGATGVTGSTGVQGSTGITGATGASGIGAVGATGITGATGSQGNTGIGIQGSTGAQGSQGNTGVAGSTGADGTIGATGSQGNTGADGLQGATGSQGIQGSTGISGATGSDGSIGATGSQGSTGATGIQGVQGIQGSTGIQGIQGDTGVQGVQGVQGSTGTIGATGVQGIEGATGVQGTQGNTGVTGATGAQGSQGNTGVVGAVGATGITGATGVQGIQGNTGVTGATGSIGASGTNAFTITTANFTQPLPNLSVPITVANNTWMAAGQIIYIGNGGYYSVSTIDIDGTDATIVNLPYAGNAAQGTTISSGSAISPGGGEGITGATGVTGATGIQGNTGAGGLQGVTGVVGATGSAGDAGNTGVTGATGVGTVGATGVGTVGATGVGTVGATGVGTVGATGATGGQGATGITGTTYDIIVDVNGLTPGYTYTSLASAFANTNDVWTGTNYSANSWNIVQSGSSTTYTYVSGGTSPGITAVIVPIGTRVGTYAQGFAAGNQGCFYVTASGANYFTVTNSTGSNQTGVTTGTGVVNIAHRFYVAPGNYTDNLVTFYPGQSIYFDNIMNLAAVSGSSFANGCFILDGANYVKLSGRIASKISLGGSSYINFWVAGFNSAVDYLDLSALVIDVAMSGSIGANYAVSWLTGPSVGAHCLYPFVSVHDTALTGSSTCYGLDIQGSYGAYRCDIYGLTSGSDIGVDFGVGGNYNQIYGISKNCHSDLLNNGTGNNTTGLIS